MVENDRNKIYIDPDKCIACGNCIRNCIHGARDYHDDTERFFSDLANGKTISLIVAPAVRTNFDDYEKLLGYLRNLGLGAVYDTSFGADICTWGYLRYIAKTGAKGLISQPCPSIVNYIEHYEPELLPRLAPVHSPALCTAIYMRNYRHIPGSYAFLSPCIAKRDEFRDANTSDLIQYNVTFQKLSSYLERKQIDYHAFEPTAYDNEAHGMGAVYPMPGGLKMNVEQHIDDAWIHQVEGQPHACHFLTRYKEENTADAPLLVDILNCAHGCNIGTGALRSESESLAVGRALHKTAVQLKAGSSRRHIPGPNFNKLDKALKLSDFIRDYSDKQVSTISINPVDVEAAFLKLRKATDAQRQVNCRSCGYTSCHHMAQAVAKGINHVGNCVEYYKSVLGEQRQQMELIAAEREAQARELRESVENILSSIQDSTRQTDGTKADVEKIDERVKQLADAAKSLGENVLLLRREIEKYVKMSDEIVYISRQTIMLSLNASIEAARAGHVGNGFAAVSEQIKRLSVRSQQSAQDALENNEVIAPILQSVNAISAMVEDESQSISENVARIRGAVSQLNRIQHEIGTAAENISISGEAR